MKRYQYRMHADVGSHFYQSRVYSSIHPQQVAPATKKSQ